jgi:hypothetical protein
MKTKYNSQNKCKPNYFRFMESLALVTSFFMFISCTGLPKMVNYFKPKPALVGEILEGKKDVENFAKSLENGLENEVNNNNNIQPTQEYFDLEVGAKEPIKGENNTPSEYFDLNVGIGENNPKDITYLDKSTPYSPSKEPSKLEKETQKTIDNVVAEEGNAIYDFVNKATGKVVDYSKKFAGHIKKNPWWQNALYGGLLLLPFLLPNSSHDGKSPYIPEHKENIKEGPGGK